MMLILDEHFETNKQEYMRMLQNSSLVRKMDDHGMLYGLPEAEERLHFCWQIIVHCERLEMNSNAGKGMQILLMNCGMFLRCLAD